MRALRSSHTGSALIITMLIVGAILIMVLFLLEKIIPSARVVKGVENGNIAYYYAESAVENALSNMSSSNPGVTMTNSIPPSSVIGSGFSIQSKGESIPLAGRGNSLYNADWNIIAPGKPVQIKWNGVGNPDFEIAVRVPPIDGIANNTTLASATPSTTPIIQWSISGENKSLVASGSQLMVDDIWAVGIVGNYFELNTKNGVPTNDLNINVNGFLSYNATICSMVSMGCTLKLSIINSLILTDGTTIPNLEYQIRTSNAIPDQFAHITASGSSYGFSKTVTKDIRQTTTNEALDFTVFQ